MNDSDFLLFHTYADHVMDQRLDPRAAAEFLVEQGLCNGIMIWVDHHRKPVHPPSAEWLRRHDLALLFEFYTNDHYAVPCARREGFGDDLTAYNNHWCRLILDYLKALGPGRSFWGLGHEHYDSFCGFSLPDESARSWRPFRRADAKDSRRTGGGSPPTRTSSTGDRNATPRCPAIAAGG